MRLDITCSTDDNYVQHYLVMLCSLFENNKQHDVFVHLIVNNNLSEQSKKLFSDLCRKYNNHCSYYYVDKEKFSNLKFRENHVLPEICYYRMLASSLLPKEIHKVLYLDGDIVVLGDLKEIFDIDYTGYGVAAVRDASPYTSLHRSEMSLSLDDRAFCAGVMMMNLDYWREHNCEDQLFEYASKNREVVYLEDQDALNFVFRHHWMALPPKWAKTPFSIIPIDGDLREFDEQEYNNDAKILHYASSQKPWYDVWFPERKYYIKYLKKLNLPNAKLSHASKSMRWRTRIACVRYYINKYIHPLVPNFIEIPLKDIYNYICLLTSVFNPKKLNRLMIKLWVDKYK